MCARRRAAYIYTYIAGESEKRRYRGKRDGNRLWISSRKLTRAPRDRGREEEVTSRRRGGVATLAAKLLCRQLFRFSRTDAHASCEKKKKEVE